MTLAEQLLPPRNPGIMKPNDAIFSADGRCRYVLQRTLVEQRLGLVQLRTLGVIMVNPSKAGAEVQDPTVRRVMGFASSLGYERVLVGNKFAHVATDIDELAHLKLDEAVGEWNDLYLSGIAHMAEQVIVAWGPLAKLPPRMRERWKDVVRILDERSKPPMCLGMAKDKHPRHPLMLPKDAALVPWQVPWFPNRNKPETQAEANARYEREADTAHASGYLASDHH